MSTQSHNKNYLLLAFVSVALVLVLLFSTCLLLKKCYLEYNAIIQDVGICTSLTDTSPLNVSIFSPGQLYLCGKIQGSTPRPAAMYLFHDNQPVFDTGFWQEPGFFIMELPIKYTSQPGEYRIELGYAKQDLASFEFTIDKPN